MSKTMEECSFAVFDIGSFKTLLYFPYSLHWLFVGTNLTYDMFGFH